MFTGDISVGKKYKGKRCAYCTSQVADTDEHVFCRKFFTVANRANLPKAPSCHRCNSAKSELEHYLAAVLPFGGRHADAVTTLKDMVPPRLAKNAKLKRSLAAGTSDVWSKTSAGLIVRTAALPFDTAKLEAYLAFAVKGLLWHHWSLYLSEDSFVQALCITTAGEKMIEHLLSLTARSSVSERLGNGTIDYRGAQGVDRPDISVWHFRLYGGIVLAGDPRAPNEETTSIAVFTAPRRVALNAKWRSGDGGLRVECLIPPVVYPRTALPVIGAGFTTGSR